jgi:hypothetical protein
MTYSLISGRVTALINQPFEVYDEAGNRFYAEVNVVTEVAQGRLFNPVLISAHGIPEAARPNVDLWARGAVGLVKGRSLFPGESAAEPSEQNLTDEQCDVATKLVVVYDSADSEREPVIWLPDAEARRFEGVLLDRSQELGGRYPNTDPADIALLEAGSNASFPGYRSVR